MIKRKRPDFKAALGQPIRTCDIEDIRVRLEAPFHPNEVDWRVGASSGQNPQGQWTNQAWAYIDARDVQRRLDRVVGFGLWDSKIRVEDKFIICDIKLKFEWDWVNRSDGTHIGDVEIDTSKKGSQNRAENREFEKGKDNVVMETKGSYSIAFKRAAVKWGIGTYLYDLPKPVRPTDAKTRQFGPWSNIEFWMIAAHTYAEYREDVGAAWGPEEKGEDFAIWARRKDIDMSEVLNHQGQPIFDTQESLTRWCEGRGMDPTKVPFTRKRSAPKTTQPTSTEPVNNARPPVAAENPNPPPNTAPTTSAAPNIPTQPTAPTPQNLPVTPSAPMDAPKSVDSDQPTQSHPVYSLITKAANTDDIERLIAMIGELFRNEKVSLPIVTDMFEKLYARFVVLANNKEAPIAPEVLKASYKKYFAERKQVDATWQPPPPKQKPPQQ